jgi:hypothetical protein
VHELRPGLERRVDGGREHGHVEPRVQSHRRFRNRRTEYISESGVKWMSRSAKRQCDRALAVPVSSERHPPAAGRGSDHHAAACWGRKGPYYTVAHINLHTALHLNTNKSALRQRKLPRRSVRSPRGAAVDEGRGAPLRGRMLRRGVRRLRLIWGSYGVGLGRIVALHYRLSTLYNIH